MQDNRQLLALFVTLLALLLVALIIYSPIKKWITIPQPETDAPLAADEVVVKRIADEIVRLNKLPNQDRIDAGQTLKMPPLSYR